MDSTTTQEARAKKLLAAEREHEAKLARKREHEQEQSELRDAIRKIKQQDREIEREQARQEAEAEAAEVAARRYELEQRLEQEAMALNRSIAELEALDRRHRDALVRAGQSPGHSGSLKRIIPRWFAHRFGGFNSLTGVLGSHPGGGKDRPLHARDPLSRERAGDGAA